jgi:hypothetical protein
MCNDTILREGIELKTLPFDRTVYKIYPFCLLYCLNNVKVRWKILTENCCHFHTMYKKYFVLFNNFSERY